MIYLKGVILGCVALAFFVVAFFIVEMIWVSHQVSGPVSIDIIRFARWPPVWLGAIASFIICFYWAVSKNVRRRLLR